MGRIKTPNRNYDIPDLDEAANIPKDLQTLATAVDSDMKAAMDSTSALGRTVTFTQANGVSAAAGFTLSNLTIKVRNGSVWWAGLVQASATSGSSTSTTLPVITFSGAVASALSTLASNYAGTGQVAGGMTGITVVSSTGLNLSYRSANPTSGQYVLLQGSAVLG